MKFKISFCCFMVFILVGCNSSSFTGSSTRKPKQSETKIEEITIDTSKQEIPKIDDVEAEGARATINLNQEMNAITKFKDRAFWVVTTTNQIYYLNLEDEGAKLKPGYPKHFTYHGGYGGTRTYVTEAGLVIGKGDGGCNLYNCLTYDDKNVCTKYGTTCLDWKSLGPHIYVFNKDDPAETNYKTPLWSAPTEKSYAPSRGCVVSYMKNNGRYIGMGWWKNHGSSQTKRYFVEFPMLNEEPYTIKFNEAQIYDAGDGAWGYGCYIYQNSERSIYYADNGYSTKIFAFDLKEMKDVSAAADFPAANRDFYSTNLSGDAFLNPKDGATSAKRNSYSIAGDPLGNILTGHSYTFVYEPKTKTVWRTARHPFDPYLGDGKLSVYPHKCFYETAVCEGFKDNDNPIAGYSGDNANSMLGPLSAFGDGSIVTVVRYTSPSRAYLLSLKDEKAILAGINADLISDADGKAISFNGDPYMYNDFSGSTLYAVPIEKTFDLSTQENFIVDYVPGEIYFNWQVKTGKPDVWSDIKMELRCYKTGEDPLPDFEEVKDVQNAGTDTRINVTSCGNKSFDKIDMKLTQLNRSLTLTYVENISFKIKYNSK